jgi:hypothetical protein
MPDKAPAFPTNPEYVGFTRFGCKASIFSDACKTQQ